MQKKKMSKPMFISAFVVAAIILGIIVYRVYQELVINQSADIWMDIILGVVAILLLVRVIYVYKKQN